ncbi:MAG TPA: aldehyde dehydrogenase family protein [Candidatus Paceibacterota bacterium]|nr:aldehyde dehydrogenase family protein [Verrucomicrobiota bacterium]HSA11897.1 aldehyde dehydrogenase family protein [Candidatus Paceibacterota bacterium]
MTSTRRSKTRLTASTSTVATLQRLGLKAENPGVFCDEWLGSGKALKCISPIDGRALATVRTATAQDYERAILRAQEAFCEWQLVPAPRRGEIVRQLGNALRNAKRDLGRLVTLEMGKILAEGQGEVQEMIDICDFAVGLSRQLYGLTIASERPQHRMMEQWHPLGVVGVITAFNFPVAVWSWNSALAAVCGDATLWKPSSQTPLTAIATVRIAERICRANKVNPAIFSLVIGDGATVGERLINDPRIPLISATGSTRMGRHAAEVVARRLGRSLLELGGNNAIVVTPTADLDLALRAILFGAVGTAGQRCTTTRRIILHESLREPLTRSLVEAYGQVRIGNPLNAGTLMGPLINARAVADMQAALAEVRKEGGQVLYGGEPLRGPDYPGGCYVRPCLVAARHDMRIVREETFAPILYLITYRTLDEAIACHNSVPQGLSSAIFTNDLREAERFLSACGSDCGIANVNIGTSGAEIGGAFGGEKETGGGRESGSDAWKAYMRRQTVTVNYSKELPLAQGIVFG